MGPDAPYIPIVGQNLEGTGGSGLAQNYDMDPQLEQQPLKTTQNKIKSDGSELLKVELKY